MKGPSLLLLSAFLLSPLVANQPAAADALDDLSHWIVEQAPGGRVKAQNGVLVIKDVEGCTVWWREKLTAPVEISYTATVVDAGGPYDRVSDLNCFWMASDPQHPDDLFAAGHGRNGRFHTYDQLQTYYVGYGGNYNGTTRFRRYMGTGARPLLPEHDLTEPRFLLEGNREYRIKLVALPNGTVQYYRDGELIYDIRDPEPLREGWFGFRTVKSHLRFKDFKIARPE